MAKIKKFNEEHLTPEERRKEGKANESINSDDELWELISDGQIQVYNKVTNKKVWVDLDSLLDAFNHG